MERKLGPVDLKFLIPEFPPVPGPGVLELLGSFFPSQNSQGSVPALCSESVGKLSPLPSPDFPWIFIYLECPSGVAPLGLREFSVWDWWFGDTIPWEGILQPNPEACLEKSKGKQNSKGIKGMKVKIQALGGNGEGEENAVPGNSMESLNMQVLTQNPTRESLENSPRAEGIL